MAARGGSQGTEASVGSTPTKQRTLGRNTQGIRKQPPWETQGRATVSADRGRARLPDQ